MTRDEMVKKVKSKMCKDCGIYLGGGKCSYNCSVIEIIEALEKEPCEDAISRLATIDRMGKWEYHKNILRALPSVTCPGKANRWIPVSERLPEAGEYVGDVDKYYLVQNEYGDMMVARYTHSEYWEQMYQLKPIADNIVAWCELPQPYKAESEDKG